MISALLVASVLSANPGFGEFAGKDLTKLDAKGSARLKAISLGILPKEDVEPTDPMVAFIAPEPHWIKPYRSGSTRWLYLMVYPGYNSPEASYLRAYGLDKDWKLVQRYEFSTGYRMKFVTARLATQRWIPKPILSLRVSAASPSKEEQENASRPLALREVEQSYTFDELGASLIGLEGFGGVLFGNSYRNGPPDMGPFTSGRAAKEWTADLNSADPVRQLSALIWLSGEHLPSGEPRQSNVNMEAVVDSRAYERLRSDPAILLKVSSLSESPNAWVSRRAAFTLKMLNSLKSHEEPDPPAQARP